MAAILEDNIFKSIFFSENDGIQIQISLNFVPRSLIDNWNIVSGNGLATNRRHAITGTNDDPVHRRIFEALWGDEFSRAVTYHC